MNISWGIVKTVCMRFVRYLFLFSLFIFAHEALSMEVPWEKLKKEREEQGENHKREYSEDEIKSILSKAMIPSMSFKDATLNDVLKYATTVYFEYGFSLPYEQREIAKNMYFAALDNVKDLSITWGGENISAEEFCKIISQKLDLEYSIIGTKILFYKKGDQKGLNDYQNKPKKVNMTVSDYWFPKKFVENKTGLKGVNAVKEYFKNKGIDFESSTIEYSTEDQDDEVSVMVKASEDIHEIIGTESYLISYLSYDENSSISPEAKALASEMNRFGFEYYQKSLLGSQNNVLQSTYSIFEVLEVLNAGASGETQKELNNLLFGGKTGNFTKYTQELREALKPSERGGYVLNINNGWWMDQKISIHPAFAEEVQKNFDMKLNLTSFEDKNKVAEQINQWAEESTKGLIKNLISPGDIPVGGLGVIANSIYLKALWGDEFDAKDTKPEPFFQSDKKKLMVQMMNGKRWFGLYNKKEGVEMLSLGLMGNFEMLIFLPENEKTFQEFDRKLSLDLLQDFRQSGEVVIANVRLPRFKYENDNEVRTVLEKMGVAGIFSDKADFTKITDFRPVYVNDIRQKTFIGVDEEGIEAAAVTYTALSTARADDRKEPKKILFKVDRPFIYLIRHQYSGLILFTGKVFEPEIAPSTK